VSEGGWRRPGREVQCLRGREGQRAEGKKLVSGGRAEEEQTRGRGGAEEGQEEGMHIRDSPAISASKGFSVT
jgi:hypothetical protein